MNKDIFTIVEELSNVGATRELSGVFVDDLDSKITKNFTYNFDWVEKHYTVYIEDYQLLNSVDRQELDEFFSGEHELIAEIWIKSNEVIEDEIRRIFGWRTSLRAKHSKNFTREVFSYILATPAPFNDCIPYEDYREAFKHVISERLELT